MKKILLSLIPAFLLVFCFAGTSQQVIVEIPIVTNPPSTDIPRGNTGPDFTCFLLPATSTLLLSSSTISETVNVVVENTETGAVISQILYVSSIPNSIVISGVGDYEITITRATGEEYIGHFDL